METPVEAVAEGIAAVWHQVEHAKKRDFNGAEVRTEDILAPAVRADHPMGRHDGSSYGD